MARTMDPTSKATFPNDFVASTWANGTESWYNVYSWVYSQNESDNGESIRSSTSSQPQTSPSSGLDDHEHRLLCDTPSSPIDPPSFFNNNNNKTSELDLNTSWFNPPPLTTSLIQAQNPAPVQQKKQESESKDYALLQELLRLNLNNSPPTSASNLSNSNPIFSSASPSTSSPWSLPQDDQSIHRPAPVSRTAPSASINQNVYWNTPATRQTTDADFLQALSTQLASCQVSQQTQPSGVDMTYIMQQQALAVQQQQNNRQWPPKTVFQRYSLMGALQAKVDEVTDEYRQLEKERKQTEAELARHNLGKKISSSNGLPIPKLPTAPSRIDRMVVDFFREHARISTLLAKMEQLTGKAMPMAAHQTLSELLQAISSLYHSRVHERALILQQLRGEAIHYDEEKEAGVLVEILCLVQQAATRVRAANWYCLMTTLGPLDANQRMQMDQIASSDFTIPPPPIRPRPV
uniref:NR LBD domain-containing protein n=1 Tax=Caenorhabditis tropicalis TaxID=1561998 RepID=A0A1I7TMA3_9PELO